MKVIAITQARYNSTRLPGKVLKTINGKSLLSHHIERIKKSKNINHIVVATTTESQAKQIEQQALLHDCDIYKGSITDVLDRFYQAAKLHLPDYIVRVTSDCPLIDPDLIDKVIENCIEGGFDYCSNTIDPHFPDGMDVEVFKYSALEKAWHEATQEFEREHVTPFIWQNSNINGHSIFTTKNYSYKYNFSNFRLTVDEPSDFLVISKLISELGADKSWREYVAYLITHKEIFEINAHIKRNEGVLK